MVAATRPISSPPAPAPPPAASKLLLPASSWADRRGTFRRRWGWDGRCGGWSEEMRRFLAAAVLPLLPFIPNGKRPIKMRRFSSNWAIISVRGWRSNLIRGGAFLKWRRYFLSPALRERSWHKRVGRNKTGRKKIAERARQSANRSAASAKGGATLACVNQYQLLHRSIKIRRRNFTAPLYSEQWALGPPCSAGLVKSPSKVPPPPPPLWPVAIWP